MARRNFQNGWSCRDGTGTGFVWDLNGHIVTNFHVIQNAKTSFKRGSETASSTFNWHFGYYIVFMAKLIVKVDLRDVKVIAGHQILRLREDLSIRLQDALMLSKIGRWVDDLQTAENIEIILEVTDYIKALVVLETTFRDHHMYSMIKVYQQAA